MKAFIYRNLSANGFLSETSILGKKKLPKKWQKPHISAGSRNLKKLKKCDPPLKLKINGGPSSSIFSEISDFWPKKWQKVHTSEKSEN